MIQKVKSFQTSDGSSFVKIEDAQKYEIQCLLGPLPEIHRTDGSPASFSTRNEQIANFLISKGTEFADILTMTPKSLPKARSANGGRKNRASKAAAQTDQPAAASL